MYRTGVYFGRFLPPHRGHLYQMIEASTRCEKLLVVISDNADQTREICRRDGIPEISYRLRKQWISQQIQDITHIGVRVLDETDIPVYPQGWELWSQRMREVVGEPIDAFFVGDMEYGETLARYFPESKVELFDPARAIPSQPRTSGETFWATGITSWAPRVLSLPKRCSSPARKAAERPR